MNKFSIESTVSTRGMVMPELHLDYSIIYSYDGRLATLGGVRRTNPSCFKISGPLLAESVPLVENQPGASL